MPSLRDVGRPIGDVALDDMDIFDVLLQLCVWQLSKINTDLIQIRSYIDRQQCVEDGYLRNILYPFGFLGQCQWKQDVVMETFRTHWLLAFNFWIYSTFSFWKGVHHLHIQIQEYGHFAQQIEYSSQPFDLAIWVKRFGLLAFHGLANGPYNCHLKNKPKLVFIRTKSIINIVLSLPACNTRTSAWLLEASRQKQIILLTK